MRNLTCIVCPNSCRITAVERDGAWHVEGNLCPRGRDFAINEITDPKRSICSTVRTVCVQMPRLPVRTAGEAPKGSIMLIMKELDSILVDHMAKGGEVIAENICGTGVNLIAVSDMEFILGSFGNDTSIIGPII
jgi:CxxC motif-containing protein